MGLIDILKPLSTVLSMPSINLSNIKRKFLENLEPNLGLLGEKQVCYLCSILPQTAFSICTWCIVAHKAQLISGASPKFQRNPKKVFMEIRLGYC